MNEKNLEFKKQKEVNVIVKCPNCGTELSAPNQKYCEFCGVELEIVNPEPKAAVKKNYFSSRSKRRCC